MHRWFVLSSILLAACQGAAPTAQKDLAGSEWMPANTPGQFIQFRGDQTFIGNTGCNEAFGTWSQAGAEVSIVVDGVTKKACPPPAMEGEQRFLRIMAGARRVDGSHFILVLKDDAGVELWTLRRSDWD